MFYIAQMLYLSLTCISKKISLQWVGEGETQLLCKTHRPIQRSLNFNWIFSKVEGAQWTLKELSNHNELDSQQSQINICFMLVLIT